MHRAEIDDNCAVHIMHCLLHAVHPSPVYCVELLSCVVLNCVELSREELPAGDKCGLPDYKSRK